jgi:hypothetical protein
MNKIKNWTNFNESNTYTYTLLMEVVIGAMKDLTTQRKIGNWTNKLR